MSSACSAKPRPGNRVKRPNPGRSVVITRRERSCHGLRSARTPHRLPGTPGNRSNGTPSALPNSVQAIVRPSGNSSERSAMSSSSMQRGCPRDANATRAQSDGERRAVG